MTPSAPAVAIARTWAGLLTPNPTATGIGDAALTSRTSLPTDAGRLDPGARDPDERHAVEEPAAAPRDPGATIWRRGRRDKVDDGQAGGAGDDLERRSFVGGEVGDDQARRAGTGQARGHRLAVPATDDLVGIPHRHEWEIRPGGPDPLDRAGATVPAWRQPPAPHPTPAGAWRHRRAGPSTAARPRAGPRRRRRRASAASKTRVRVGVARDDVRDERDPAVVVGSSERGRDAPGAGGPVRAGPARGSGSLLDDGAHRASRARRPRPAAVPSWRQASSMVSAQDGIGTPAKARSHPAVPPDIGRDERHVREMRRSARSGPPSRSGSAAGPSPAMIR